MEGGIASSKLDFDNPNREKMRKVVLIVLKKAVDLSNANLIKNIDGLISNKSTNQGVEGRGGGRRLANVDLKINLRCPIDFFCYCSL